MEDNSGQQYSTFNITGSEQTRLRHVHLPTVSTDSMYSKITKSLASQHNIYHTAQSMSEPSLLGNLILTTSVENLQLLVGKKVNKTNNYISQRMLVFDEFSSGLG